MSKAISKQQDNEIELQWGTTVERVSKKQTIHVQWVSVRQQGTDRAGRNPKPPFRYFKDPSVLLVWNYPSGPRSQKAVFNFWNNDNRIILELARNSALNDKLKIGATKWLRTDKNWTKLFNWFKLNCKFWFRLV